MASIYTIDDMREIASYHGGKCLSKVFLNTSTPLAWMCSRGHTWDAPYSIIRQGGWCMACVKENDKELLLEKIKKAAIKKGGKCLSDKYINAAAHLDFICKEGHRWQTSPNIILRGSWCPKCAGKAKPTLEELQKLAKSRGGRFLSKKYVNNFSPLKWECRKGHQWTSDYSNVKNNETWCPYCYGNVTKTIDEIRQLAKAKGGKCLSNVYINNRQKLKFECSKGHTWMAPAHQMITHNSWCPDCSGKRKKTIRDMQLLAKKKNGKCLSTIYISSKSKLKWQCHRKHIWMTTPGNIVAGCWCPRCVAANRLEGYFKKITK